MFERSGQFEEFARKEKHNGFHKERNNLGIDSSIERSSSEDRIQPIDALQQDCEELIPAPGIARRPGSWLAESRSGRLD